MAENVELSRVLKAAAAVGLSLSAVLRPTSRCSEWVVLPTGPADVGAATETFSLNSSSSHSLVLL